MHKHEVKNCPRCHAAFECKAGSITQCQCSSIRLVDEERIYVESRYEDCLCINCLVFLQQEYAVFKELHIYKQP
ncbi:MAG TPA: cysteine-rich CWC family protein [Ferruginibacter sp.]|nr:hypothetical protein [Chitinophagaceae bacterium]HRI26380.1 cysteine-rich CWC family protein [Ferruginibacter sp.]